MLRILLACGGGFSSSHLSQVLSKGIIQLDLQNEVQIDYLHHIQYQKESLMNYDIIMCCPHLRFTLDRMIKDYQINDIPIYVLPPMMYGCISIKELMIDAKDIVEIFKETHQNPCYFPGEEDTLRSKRKVAYRNFHQIDVE